ncbi:hypothetical protein ACIP6P_12095 [Streptomyces sp. NPDC088729]|uniref:hypothetical protein n=1 Tax=Streptomyces sp. NPDC088729 TaxID=3365876 RepID=UPI0037FB640F
MTCHDLRRRGTSTTLALATFTAGLAIAGVSAPVAAAADPVSAPARAIDPGSLDLSRWMSQTDGVIGDRPLNKVIMPGSHNAGSWSITDRSGVCDTASQATLARDHPQIAATLSITQKSSIRQQLEGGSRFLDLRVCKQNGQWYTYHGGPLGGLFFDDPSTGRRGEINEIAEWIRTHPKEIVTIELSTSAPNEDPGANSEAVRLLGQAIGTWRMADRNTLSPTSTYNQFMAAGAHVVLLDNKNTTSESWAWPGSRSEGRNSYVENKDWGSLLKEALKNPFKPNPATDLISRKSIDRNQQVLANDKGDPAKLFVLSGAVDSALAIPDAVWEVISHGLDYTPDGEPYMLYLAREHNTRLLKKLEGDWRHSIIAENTNVVQIDYVDMGGKRGDGTTVASGLMSAAIIADNTPTTAPGTLMGAERGTGGAWSAAAPLPGAYGSSEFAGGEQAVAAMPDGSLQFLAYGNDQRMYHNVRRADGSWQGWARVNDDATDKRLGGGPIALTSTPDGTLQALTVDKDANLLHTLRRPDGTWQEGGWAGVADNDKRVMKAKDVSVTGLPDNSVKVLAYGKDGAMRLTERYADGAWAAAGWRTLPGTGGSPTFAGSDLSIAAQPDRSVQIAAIGQDGQVWHMVQNAAGVGSAWGNPLWGGKPMRASAVSLAALPNGSTQLMAVGADGVGWHSARAADGSWTAFEALRGPWNRALGGTGVKIAGLPDGRTYTLVSAR